MFLYILHLKKIFRCAGMLKMKGYNMYLKIMMRILKKKIIDRNTTYRIQLYIAKNYSSDRITLKFIKLFRIKHSGNYYYYQKTCLEVTRPLTDVHKKFIH